MSKKDYYETLGVSKNASNADLKKAYRRLAMKYHPDRNPGQAAEEQFKEVKESYEILSDAQKRSAYDQFGHAGVDQSSGGGGGPGGAGFGDVFGDIFGDIFGGGGGGGGAPSLGGGGGVGAPPPGGGSSANPTAQNIVNVRMKMILVIRFFIGDLLCYIPSFNFARSQ